MKKVLNSDSINDEAFIYGYSLSWKIEHDKITSIECKAQEGLMPEFEITPDRDEDTGAYFLHVTICNFPELIDEEMEFSDSYLYYIEKWQDAGRLAGLLFKAEYLPE